MSKKSLEELSREELIRELRKLQAMARHPAATREGEDREHLIHELYVHQVELEMQNRELRESQERLEEMTARYVDLYDFAPVGYCTLTPEGVIREINLTGAKLLGRPREQLLSKPFARVSPLQDRLRFEEHLERCRSEVGRVRSELALRPDGNGARILHVVSEPMRDAGGAVSGLRMILIDISELKQLEEKLRLLSEAGEALSASLDYTAVLRTLVRLTVPALADVCIVDWVRDDGEMERRLVAFADERKQMALAEEMQAFSPGPGWRTAQARAMASGEPVLVSEVSAKGQAELAHDARHAELLRAVGLCSLLVVPLSARGRSLGALTLMSAESQRRYSRLELQVAHGLAIRAALAADNARLYAEARRAVAARESILALVSHDLRTPLSVILMSAPALLEALGQEESRAPSRRFVEAIARSAEQMNRLIQDLLDVSSIEAGHFSVRRCRQPLRDLMGETRERLQVEADARAQSLVWDLPAGDDFEVDCDRFRVLQVLSNLIGNALKFSPSGGSVHVRVEPKRGEILFSIRDSGPGIAPANRPHVFERFWQATGTAHLGTGLGLSISKGIVEAHGGRIGFESRPGEGSTFYFTLPRILPHGEQARDPRPGPRPALAAEAAESRMPAREPVRPGPVVLVVEDDPEGREILRLTLDHAGYAVDAVSNGAEALEYLQHRARPSLVLLDLAMPVMDGWSFLAARDRDATLRSIPVIVLSAQRDVEARIEAAHASHLAKPIAPDRLLEAVEHAVH